jgi:hypothetical protein
VKTIHFATMMIRRLLLFSIRSTFNTQIRFASFVIVNKTIKAEEVHNPFNQSH